MTGTDKIHEAALWELFGMGFEDFDKNLNILRLEPNFDLAIGRLID